MSEIQAMIFDLDGVLTDTAEHHYLGWQRLAQEQGIALDRQAGDKLRGLTRRASLLAVLGERRASEEEIQQMMERKNRYYIQSLGSINDTAVLPGVIRLLSGARSLGIRLAVGSASKNAKTVIERLGIADYFDAVADGHTVSVGKPAPDLFLAVAGMLGVAPGSAVVFEDAQSGVAAALAGGFAVVGLGPPDRVGAAHVIYPDLSGVTVEKVLADVAAVVT